MFDRDRPSGVIAERKHEAMFGLRSGGMGFLASASFLLAAPAWPGGCGGVDPGTGGTAGVGGAPMTCGNGQRQEPEECDGTDFGGQLCSDFDYDGGTLKCTSQCRRDYSGCTTNNVCGNGVLERYEECDGQQIDTGYAQCPFPAIGGTVRCNSQCKVDTSGCIQPVCGNGVIENGEECDGADLGNYNATRTCDSLYFATSIFGVRTNFTGGDIQCTSCKIDRTECTTPRGCYHVYVGPTYQGVICY